MDFHPALYTIKTAFEDTSYARVINALKRAGVTRLGQLSFVAEKALLEVPGFGRGALLLAAQILEENALPAMGSMGDYKVHVGKLPVPKQDFPLDDDEAVVQFLTAHLDKIDNTRNRAFLNLADKEAVERIANRARAAFHNEAGRATPKMLETFRRQVAALATAILADNPTPSSPGRKSRKP